MIKAENVMQVVSRMSDIIIANEIYFCHLDSAAGDGDFGMSLAKGFKQIKEEWADLSTDSISTFLKSAGMVITEHCGGASGPIWGSAFRGAARYAKGKDELNVLELSEMLDGAVKGIQKIGGAKLGDKTLLDALIPAVEAIKASADRGDQIEIAVKEAAKAAQLGAEKTKDIVASKGRATYLGERSLNHPDAGAMGVSVIINELIGIKQEVS